MAQTKQARASTSRARSSSSSNARSKGSQSKRTSSNGRQSRSNGRSSASRGRSAASRRKTSANGVLPSRSTVSSAASKAKVPLVAGGAAVAGLAGGVLAGRRAANGGSAVKALGTAAKALTKTGYRVGQLTGEVRKAREQIEKS